MTVPTRSSTIKPRITAPTVVKLMPSRVLETELRRGSRSPKRIVFVEGGAHRECTVLACDRQERLAIIGSEEREKRPN